VRELARVAREAGATPVLLPTWGYQRGDADNPSLSPTFEEMSARLEEGYAQYAHSIRVLDGGTAIVADANSAWR